MGDASADGESSKYEQTNLEPSPFIKSTEVWGMPLVLVERDNLPGAVASLIDYAKSHENENNKPLIKGTYLDEKGLEYYSVAEAVGTINYMTRNLRNGLFARVDLTHSGALGGLISLVVTCDPEASIYSMCLVTQNNMFRLIGSNGDDLESEVNNLLNNYINPVKES